MMCYIHLPGGAGLLIRPELRIRVPPGCFHDVLYASPPVVRACCLGRNLMIHVHPGGLNDLIYAPPPPPPGGAGVLIRPEVMFHVPFGSLHDVLYAPCGLHNML